MFEFLIFMGKFARKSLRIRLILVALINVAVSSLELFAIYVFARVLTSLIKEEGLILPGSFLLSWMNFTQLSREHQYSVGLVVVISLIALKSLLILTISKVTINFLAKEFAQTSERVFLTLCQRGIVHIRESSSYEVFMAVNTGIRDLIVVGYNALINIAVESVLVIVLLVVILANGGLPNLIIFTYFVLVFFTIGKITGIVHTDQSARFTGLNLNSMITVQTVIESFREIKEFKSIKYFVDKYAADVADGARASAKLQYISFVPKLIIEATFIIGVATYALVAIRTGNLTDALVNISFFVAMGSRVIPSLLRLHFSVSQVKQIRGTTIHTQKLVAREYLLAEGDKKIEEGKFIREDLNSEEILLEMDSVHFQYPNTNEEAISDFSLKITKAQSLGVVGRTGSGKSTIIDLILGTIVPSRGNVVLRYEGKIGFVPQSIALIDGTIIDNLLLGRDLSNYSTEDFNLALRLAGLLPHIDSLDEKLHHKLSRAGSELSGGQRQKLGIARALLDKPQLLVLDEASSSLDQESEDYLNNTIESLKGKVTIIMIAHRLTTIRNLDQVILMEKGRLVAQGKFEELVRTNQLFSDFVRYSQIK